jgi:hypothetical protein
VALGSLCYARPAAVERRDLEFTGGGSGWDRPGPDGARVAVRPDGTVQGLAALPRLLHGDGHPDLCTPFTFELDCAEPTRFAVHVGTVSAGAVLEFRLDGEEVRVVDLPAGEGLGWGSEWQEEWGIWQTRYDEWLDIPVPAGRHVVRIENMGQDWIEVLAVRLTGYVTNQSPHLRVMGLAAADRVLLWAQNTRHTWFRVRDGGRIPGVAPTCLGLKGLADGMWTVQLWDTHEGEMLRTAFATVTDGRLSLELPRIERDVAVKLIRRGAP